MASTDTRTKTLLKLARRAGMIRPVDLDAIGVPRTYLSRLTANGRLVKTGRGLYVLAENEQRASDGLAVVATKVPQAVFCLLTALQFHELTTQLPRDIWIAMPRGSHVPRIDYPPLTMIQFSSESYSEGIETHKRDRVKIRVYSVAKTIADCFKHRSKVGLDVALEALKKAKAHGLVDANELWRCAKICRVANVMRPYLEALE